MKLELSVDPLPLRVDADGAIRVGRTRVPLDTVVGAFNDGESAEGIADAYSSLRLADVYAAIAYYLGHRSEVEAYLQERRRRSEAVRRENERRFPPDGVRERLLARQSKRMQTPAC